MRQIVRQIPRHGGGRRRRRAGILCEALEPRRLLATTGTISGTLFNDLNNNGVQNTGEAGLAGWTVFLDTNKNGRLDSGELSTTTNASGQYTFTNVPLGTYQVAEVLPTGYIQTVPGATGLSLTAGTSVTVSSSTPHVSAADLPVVSAPAGQAHSTAIFRGTVPLGSVAGKPAKSKSSKKSAAAASVSASPATLLGEQELTPSEYDTAYGLSGLSFGSVAANGAGQTIAIIDVYNDPDIASDLAEFDSYFGVAAPPSFQVVSQTGSTTALPADSGTSGWSLEESLDVEWAHAVAPDANIVLVEANSASFSDLWTAVDWARNDTGVSVVSMSFSGSESSGFYSSYDNHFTTPPGHPGVTFLAATGDYGKYAGQGSTAVAVGYPASSSYVVAVGGSSLLLADTSGDYGAEYTWGNGATTNTSGGGGGGISTSNIQPPYQTGTVTQSTKYRTTPDLALDANPDTGALLIDSYDYPGYLVGVGGTSFATPSMAGMIAIADQGRALIGKAPLDGPTQTLPAIYQLPASDFNVISTGSPSLAGVGNNGYATSSGYDLDTGRGSPIANLFIPGLVSYNSQQPVHELSVTLTSSKTTATGEIFPDQFTDLPPTVATAPTAVASNSGGVTYALNVLGASAAGASNLTYTWSVAPNAPGTVTFAANGTNAAKATIATFSVAGAYTLDVQITDAQGLFVTASVLVNASASFDSLPGTTLTVIGSSAANTISLTTASGQLTVTLNGVVGLPVLLSEITAILVLGGNGNDSISLDPNTPATTIVGGTGIDTVITASTALVTFVDDNAGAGLIKQGAGILTLSSANAYATTVIDAGTLLVSSAGALPPNSTLVDNGQLNVAANSVLADLSGTGGLTVENNAVLQLAPSAPSATTSSIGSLTTDAGSQLDIANNAILINESFDSLAAIASMVNAGNNGGLWNGSGIVSSDVVPNSPGGSNYANDLNGQKTVAYADSDPATNLIPAGEVEVKYTVLGDLNLDGQVNLTDYLILARSFNSTDATYQNGDLNGDGDVDLTDYLLLARDFNFSLNPVTGL